MDRTRMYGGLICLGTVLFGLWFMAGVFAGGRWGYVALAVPVSIITLTLLGLIFWIGYTIWSIKVEPPEEEEK